MHKLTFFIVAILSSQILAEAPKKKTGIDLSLLGVPKDLKINPNPIIYVEETEVFINGVKYSQINYSNSIFYTRFLSPTQGQSTATPSECLIKPKGEPPSRILIESSKSIRKTKTKFFIETLKIKCGEQLSWNEFINRLKDVKIGVYLPEGPKDKIKKKKIYYNPLSNSLNLGGDF
jgi:hypothetical protein